MALIRTNILPQGQPKSAMFARKELVSNHTTPLKFHLERKNLELVKTLNDKHIVQIIKAYNLGGTFNIFMPCAKTNLGRFMREARWNAESLYRNVPIEQSQVWKQLLGVAKAIHKIQMSKTEDAPDAGSQRRHPIRCHFDIKPENICKYGFQRRECVSY